MGSLIYDTPRIYVACLADYNAGVLTGEWIDFVDLDDVWLSVKKMLTKAEYPNVTADCPVCKNGDEAEAKDCEFCKGQGRMRSAEEWAVHDHEGWHGLLDSEWPDFDRLAVHAEMLEKHGPAWAAYATNVGEEHADESGFEDSFRGEHSSEEDYAREFVDDCYDLEKLMGNLCHYFDYESFARDMFRGGDCWSEESDGGVYVFVNN